MFVQAVRAVAFGGVVTVTVHPSTLVCNGPDDIHFDTSTTASTVFLQTGSRVTVVRADTSVSTVAIHPTELPGWLNSDQNERIFQLTGPADAVTALDEQYHP